MEKEKRKSQKKKKIIVSSANFNRMFLLIFSLENGKSFCIGASNIDHFDNPLEICDKVISIFKNIDNEFTYCSIDDIQEKIRGFYE